MFDKLEFVFLFHLMSNLLFFKGSWSLLCALHRKFVDNQLRTKLILYAFIFYLMRVVGVAYGTFCYKVGQTNEKSRNNSPLMFRSPGFDEKIDSTQAANSGAEK